MTVFAPEDHGHVLGRGLGLEQAAQLGARDAGHRQVGDHDARRLLESTDRLYAVVRGRDFVPERTQSGRKGVSRVGLRIDEEDAAYARHGP